MNNKWVEFGNKLPKLGDNIEIMFDDGTLFDGSYGDRSYGKLTKIIDTRNLSGETCIITDKSIKGKAWSLCSDKYINSIVRHNYKWRLFSRKIH